MTDNKAMLSKTASTSRRIINAEFLMRDPYRMTRIMRLFNTVPMPHTFTANRKSNKSDEDW